MRHIAESFKQILQDGRRIHRVVPQPCASASGAEQPTQRVDRWPVEKGPEILRPDKRGAGFCICSIAAHLQPTAPTPARFPSVVHARLSLPRARSPPSSVAAATLAAHPKTLSSQAGNHSHWSCSQRLVAVNETQCQVLLYSCGVCHRTGKLCCHAVVLTSEEVCRGQSAGLLAI